MLGVNRNTVLRALRLLRDEGLLEFRRDRGVTVTGTPEQGTMLAQARELLAQAQRYGYGRKELIKIIEDLPRPEPPSASALGGIGRRSACRKGPG